MGFFPLNACHKQSVKNILRQNLLRYVIHMGHVVSQLVEALRYKSECRRFDSRWCHWNFSLA